MATGGYYGGLGYIDDTAATDERYVKRAEYYAAGQIGTYDLSLGDFNVVPPGANGYVLTSRPALSTGLAWEPAGGLNISGAPLGGVSSGGSGLVITPNPITGAGTLALSASGATPGTYGSANTVAQSTIDIAGRTTLITNVPIAAQTINTTAPITGGGSISPGGALTLSLAASGVTAGTYTAATVTITDRGIITAASSAAVKTLSNGTGITISGPASWYSSNAVPTSISISNTGVVGGSYGSATQVPTFTVNNQGQITLAGNVAISGGALGSITVTPAGPLTVSGSPVSLGGSITLTNTALNDIPTGCWVAGTGVSLGAGSTNTILIGGTAKSVASALGSVVVGVAASVGGSDCISMGSGAGGSLGILTASRCYYIGSSAGANNTGAGSSDNIFMGYLSGFNATSTSDCIFLGSNAGSAGIGLTVTQCISIGNSTRGSNASVVIGHGARSGDQSVIMGFNAANNSPGGALTSIGYNSGKGLGASNSTFMGHSAGLVCTGVSNTFIGGAAGSTATTGSGNTLVGSSVAVVTATVSSGCAFGTSAQVGGAESSTFGFNSLVTGSNCSAFGARASATGANDSAVGWTAIANGTNGAAFGHSAQTTGAFACAFGQGAQANAARSNSIGSGVINNTANTSLIGSSAAPTAHVVQSTGLLQSAVQQGAAAGWIPGDPSQQTIATGTLATLDIITTRYSDGGATVQNSGGAPASTILLPLVPNHYISTAFCKISIPAPSNGSLITLTLEWSSNGGATWATLAQNIAVFANGSLAAGVTCTTSMKTQAGGLNYIRARLDNGTTQTATVTLFRISTSRIN
jgi:trimeric autotransporter adhesin